MLLRRLRARLTVFRAVRTAVPVPLLAAHRLLDPTTDKTKKPAKKKA